MFSQQEFVIGAVVGLSTYPIIGWGALVLAPICSILWAFGGTYQKSIRRYLIPLEICVVVCMVNGFHYWYLLALAAGIRILHLGDGFPDRRPTTFDEGSWLGQKVEVFFPDDRIGGPLTKWLIPVIFQASLIPYFIK